MKKKDCGRGLVCIEECVNDREKFVKYIIQDTEKLIITTKDTAKKKQDKTEREGKRGKWEEKELH